MCADCSPLARARQRAFEPEDAPITRGKETPVLPGGDARMPHCLPPYGRSALGRAAVRESGSFNIAKAQHVNWKYRQLIQRADGYGFAGSGLRPDRFPLSPSADSRHGGFDAHPH
jgi:hypothetical protein